MHKILTVARIIRETLLEEFPNNLKLEKQCKRASILFDIAGKQVGLDTYPVAGYITKQDDTNDYERGHVWNIVIIDDKEYILDTTLTQFEGYLGCNVPTIVLEEEYTASKRYHYKEDGYGEYEYYQDDVRISLRKSVLNKITNYQKEMQ